MKPLLVNKETIFALDLIHDIVSSYQLPKNVSEKSSVNLMRSDTQVEDSITDLRGYLLPTYQSVLTSSVFSESVPLSHSHSTFLTYPETPTAIDMSQYDKHTTASVKTILLSCSSLNMTLAEAQRGLKYFPPVLKYKILRVQVCISEQSKVGLCMHIFLRFNVSLFQFGSFHAFTESYISVFIMFI